MGVHLLRDFYAALMYDEEEDYETVIQALTDHLTSNPSNAAAHHNRAVAFWEMGQIEYALADFAQAIRLAPDNAQPSKCRGMLLQQEGDLPGALADFDVAVRLAPDDPYLRRTRGHARLVASDLVGAIDDFSRAIALQPQSAAQYLYRATAYERLGQALLAEQDRATATRLDKQA